MAAGRLELLHDYVPQARRVAVLKDPTSTIATQYRLEPAADRLNLELVVLTARNGDEVGRALDEIAATHVGAVNVLASPMLNGARRLIIDRLRDNRLPSIYEWPESAADGGLLAYGAPIESLYRRVAVLIDKILHGARPADSSRPISSSSSTCGRQMRSASRSRRRCYCAPTG